MVKIENSEKKQNMRSKNLAEKSMSLLYVVFIITISKRKSNNIHQASIVTRIEKQLRLWPHLMSNSAFFRMTAIFWSDYC